MWCECIWFDGGFLVCWSESRFVIKLACSYTTVNLHLNIWIYNKSIIPPFRSHRNTHTQLDCELRNACLFFYFRLLPPWMSNRSFIFDQKKRAIELLPLWNSILCAFICYCNMFAPSSSSSSPSVLSRIASIFGILRHSLLLGIHLI